jgi:hypothetical protein
MWATTLNIVTLVSMLAALSYVALASHKLDGSLGTLLRLQRERRAELERDLERARRSLETSFPEFAENVIPAKAGIHPAPGSPPARG